MDVSIYIPVRKAIIDCVLSDCRGLSPTYSGQYSHVDKKGNHRKFIEYLQRAADEVSGKIKTFKENTTVIIMLFVFATKVVVIKIIVSLDPLYSRNVNIASQKRKLKSRQ